MKYSGTMWEKIWQIWLNIAGAHRSSDHARGVSEFFIPRMTRGFFIRLTVVVAVAALLFGFLLIPCVIDGASMVPTFPQRGFTFCWRGRYWFSAPQRGDVVVVKYTGRIFFLKRIVALPGDTVSFRDGRLLVNGKLAYEPYLRYICNWELPERTVKDNHYYVVGDNRSQPMNSHLFGQVPERRIIGAPLFSGRDASGRNVR